MASLRVREPVGDHLLTPHNAALVVINWAREETVAAVIDVVLTERLLKE
jgi:hypothetical protein